MEQTNIYCTVGKQKISPLVFFLRMSCRWRPLTWRTRFWNPSAPSRPPIPDGWDKARFFIKILNQHSLGLDSDFYLNAGLRIRIITLIRIRIRASLSALMRIRIWLITLMRIRNLLLIKVMRICDHWSNDPPWLHFEPLKLLNFDFNGDPVSALHTISNPDQLPKTKQDPRRSGSASWPSLWTSELKEKPKREVCCRITFRVKWLGGKLNQEKFHSALFSL